jgi:hypothetical protein
VVEFNKGAESWEIIPAFRKSTANEATILYDIPGVSTEWIESAPVEHIRYVNEMNQRSGISGAAKKLSRSCEGVEVLQQRAGVLVLPGDACRAVSRWREKLRLRMGYMQAT